MSELSTLFELSSTCQCFKHIESYRDYTFKKWNIKEDTNKTQRGLKYGGNNFHD